ncbi:MAG: hypothetical protein JSW27_16940, partial [Phycisphaerales bacterium]
MTFKRVLAFVLVGFCLLCAWLVVRSGATRPLPGFNQRALLLLQQTTDVSRPQAAVAAPAAVDRPQLQAATDESYNAVGGPAETLTLGSDDPESGFKFRLELDSRGAAIREA